MDAGRRGERIEALTRELTEVFSVTESRGEAEMGERIYAKLAQIPYFQNHPEYLLRLPIEDDPLERISILALVRGEQGSSGRTVVTLGHYDTVGISDYGALAQYANQPDVLAEKLKQLDLPANVREDLESGDYLFGRGVFDMKVGDAILIQLLEEVSQDAEHLEGNLIFAAVCDEEGNSKGMLRLVPELVRLKETLGLEYLALLDTDYMTAEYEGDQSKYIYMGTVGKVMPTFFIVGKETHVGEAFRGLDPNQLAAQITQRINLNPEFSDREAGMAAMPPVSLQQRDQKTEYSTQIAKTAVLFFNCVTYHSTPDQILARMRDVAEECFQQVMEQLNQRCQTYCAMLGRPAAPLPWRPRAITYQALYDAVRREAGPGLDQMVREKCGELSRDPALDACGRTTKLVKYVHSLWSDQDPVIVVYLTPPYYPHVSVRGETEKERELLAAVQQAIQAAGPQEGIVCKDFFPYISDLSYGAAPDDPEIVQVLEHNIPGYGSLYRLPLREMAKLQIPALNIGPFGYDAHKWTERLEKRYSFQVTPELVRQTVFSLLNRGEPREKDGHET